MPWGDNTGPMGMGPMTGRAMGFCAGFGAPGYTNPGFGRGFGRGRGRGFGPGFGRGWAWRDPAYPGNVPYPGNAPYPGAYPQMSADQEKQYLENEAQQLKQALQNIEDRLAELEGKSE